MTRPIRVLIVDDSALVRRALADRLSRFPDIEVIGTAVDPYVARDKILQFNPDIMTLDIEMPRMDGLTFLKLIMKHRPMPVIVMSSLTSEGSAKALEALQAGAVEVLEKPGNSAFACEEAGTLAQIIRGAVQARILHPPSESPSVRALPAAGVPFRKAKIPRKYPARTIILMGASTGGTEALKTILTGLSSDLPGICIVQHIPAHFSLAFSHRLNDLCQMEVREARAGDLVRPGLALVAPGDFHLLLRWQASAYEVQLSQGPKIHYQRPAVYVLFNAAVKAGAGPHALAILLTGMGADGAAGMLELHAAGAMTAAQSEETCVVFGMPREAIRLGAVKMVLPLAQFAGRIERYADELAL